MSFLLYKTECNNAECWGRLVGRKRDVRLRMSGSGDRSGDRGRQKTRLCERSWERTSYNGMFAFCVIVVVVVVVVNTFTAA